MSERKTRSRSGAAGSRGRGARSAAGHDAAHEDASVKGSRGSRNALAILLVYALFMGVVVTTWHPTPLYGVETDLLGEYVPAAQELRAGHLSAEHYQFKGFGYPLALAAVSAALGGDDYLGARWLKRTW